ncbi:SMP-30/gluconolactonase/LRE family protein [Klebsiella quasipneumoniae]
MTSTIAKLGFTLGLASMALATLPAQVLANSTSQSVTLQTPARIHDGLNSPVGMAYDTSGNLYVANWSAGTVLRFTPDGQRRVFAKGLSGPSGRPVGIFMSPLTVRVWSGDLRLPVNKAFLSAG